MNNNNKFLCSRSVIQAIGEVWRGVNRSQQKWSVSSQAGLIFAAMHKLTLSRMHLLTLISSHSQPASLKVQQLSLQGRSIVYIQPES